MRLAFFGFCKIQTTICLSGYLRKYRPVSNKIGEMPVNT